MIFQAPILFSSLTSSGFSTCRKTGTHLHTRKPRLTSIAFADLGVYWLIFVCPNSREPVREYTKHSEKTAELSMRDRLGMRHWGSAAELAATTGLRRAATSTAPAAATGRRRGRPARRRPHVEDRRGEEVQRSDLEVLSDPRGERLMRGTTEPPSRAPPPPNARRKRQIQTSW